MDKGYWAWDMRQGVGDKMEENGTKFKTWYCPALNPPFDERAWQILWDWAINPSAANPQEEGFRVLGYAQTFPHTKDLISDYWNEDLTHTPSIQIAYGIYQQDTLSDRVLLADVVISDYGQNDFAKRDTYNYTSVQGGFPVPHRTAHLNGKMPAGGNIGYLDGHAAWRKWTYPMKPHTSTGPPCFWW